MTTQARLLSELESCRCFIMSQLADEAEERGDVVTAAGWRWLILFRRWPWVHQNVYHDRRGDLDKNRSNRATFRWSFDSRSTLNKSSVLPFLVLVDHHCPRSSVDLKKLLSKTATAVGRWLESLKQPSKHKVGS